ncbi:aldehyde dehydrogenase family protein [Intrasporangium flavum]|uniref:aldehyde dehydrogenase family protein n=1 Tax=Intrasporangium flavum TaxID=1428657 RepID=UPI0009F9F3A5|nr:aldehyde dehydrogenase family protein [Intrasporangium flavum]
MTQTAPSDRATSGPGREPDNTPDASGARRASTPVDASAPVDVPATVAAARATFRSGRTKPYAWRVEQLEALRSLIVDHEDELAAALHEDLGKNATEAWVTELGFVVEEIDHTLRHLRSWLRPRRVPVPLSLMPGRARVVREPLGVVLVIAPWNYPVQLLLAPLVGVLAAGNAAVLKPSEVAPATSRAVARLVPLHLDASAVQVVEGGVPETTALLAERFDHVFYTGNGTVGRVVLEAAARHLTPVTLELGGKSPTYVHDDADLAVAARRIVWGKFTNAGQTCVAPDYVLGTRATLDALVPHLADAVRESYGTDPAASGEYGRIVNDRHFERLAALVDTDKVVVGGQADAATRYLAPTVLDRVSLDDPVMQDEIFGPVLPLVEVSGIDEAIEVITGRDKPLALYVFTGDADVRRRFVRDTSSGALGVNLPLAHMAVHGLPFGGVGPSGSGAYHGERSVELFSHAKAVLETPTTPDTTAVVRPPFTPFKRRVIDRVVARGRRHRSS